MNQDSTLLIDPQPKPSILALLLKTMQTLLVGAVGLLLWPLYLVSRFIWQRPPSVPRLVQIGRYLRLAWSVQPLAPGLSWQARVWLTLTILRKLPLIPILGLAWQLDELLYGRKLGKTAVVAPFFVISGGRSGSTQITRYIEADPNITAPSLLQCMFPYLWLWKLAPRTLGKLFSPEKVVERLEAMMPPELLERHEFDPFKADTFDGAFFNGHLNPLSFYLGPDVSSTEFNFAAFAPHEKALMEEDFVRLVDRIGRKQRLFIGDTKHTQPQRFFIKGHFLCAADALARHYPDATFLTVIRDPAPRLQSGINYLRVNPSDPAVGPPPWAWLAAALRQTESDYCRIEQAWYTADDPNRVVVRFADFVADLEGTMQTVYEQCFNQPTLPPHVPRTHPPRERKNYRVNRSLAELGIDAAALREELADYVAWCQPVRKGEASA